MSMTKTQMMRDVALGFLTETFSHATLGLLDVTATRALIQEMRSCGVQPLRCLFSDMRASDETVGDRTVLEWLVSQREVDWDRVAELTPSQINEPIIHAVDSDGAHYPIDGIHRLVRRAQMGKRFFRYWAIPLRLVPRPRGLVMDVPWGEMDLVAGELVRRGLTVTGRPQISCDSAPSDRTTCV